MTCANQVGVRNILISFFDCDTGRRYGPVSHELANEDQPTYRLCEYSNESLPGGRVRRTRSSQQLEITVIRNLGLPLRLYQGCSTLEITVEHFNGLVVTGIDGSVTGDELSDGYEVTMAAIFPDMDELLPEGELEAAA